MLDDFHSNFPPPLLVGHPPHFPLFRQGRGWTY
jgi:hypothetical protein